MELLKHIKKNSYKNNIDLMPTFETHYMQYQRIRTKMPPFVFGYPDSLTLSIRYSKYEVTINIYDDEFKNIKDGQDIRIILKNNGTEEAYILYNVKNIILNSEDICNYSLTACVMPVIEHINEVHE